MVKIVKYGKLSLRKEIKENDKVDTATLTWSNRNGFPRVTIYTSDNIRLKDRDGLDYSKIIIAPFDYVTIRAFINMFIDVLDRDEEVKREVECYNMKFLNGTRTDELYLQAKVIVGKDKEGVVYIAAIENNKKKIRFDLVPSNRFFKFSGDPSLENIKTLSQYYAKAYLELLQKCIAEDVIDAKTVTEIDDGKPTDQKKIPPKIKETIKTQESNSMDTIDDIPF